MIEYIELAAAALLPAAAAVLFSWLERKNKFVKIPWRVRQIIYGVIFGGFAILGTECGIPVGGAQVNSRDASVIIAGLVFGAPAGLIAGFIGGTERWFASLWGIGVYTRTACTLATYFAAIVSAIISQFLLEKKKPTWGMAVFTGVTVEVFHMMMVFFTHMHDASTAIDVIRDCTAPMIITNGFSVFAAVFVIAITAGELHLFKARKKSQIPVFETIQHGMLLVIVICLAAACMFVYSLQTNISTKTTHVLLRNAAKDACDELSRDTEDYMSDYTGLSRDELVYEEIKELARYRHVGVNGFIMITDSKSNLISSTEDNPIIDFSTWADGQELTYDKMMETTIEGVKYFYRVSLVEGYRIFALYPVSDATIERDITVYLTIFIIILVGMVIYIMLYLIIKKIIVDQIVKMADSLSMISAGKLDEVVDVTSNEEFASLSSDINSTVSTLKQYIKEAAARIDAELELAARIQLSVLPNTGLLFARRNDFDICATTDPAKEVGGDFYDAYLTGVHELTFMIADVSGKGIPAAMFMMRAKSTLKDLTENGYDLEKVFEGANASLCAGNDADMFVTAWQAKIDLNSGELEYANAGHNPPLVKHAGGKFEFLRQKPNLMLGAIETMKFRKGSFRMESGDTILLYTDGVVEAANNENKLYGDDRLLEIVNAEDYDKTEDIITAVRADVDRFADGAAQFDDITMLVFRYNGSEM